MAPLDLLIRKLVAQVDLDHGACEALRALPATVRAFEPGSYVMREGDAPFACGIMLSGFVFRHKLTVTGSRQIVAVQIGGDALDFQSLFLDVADHNIQTLTRAEIAFVPRDRLQHLVLSNPEIARAVMANLMIDASIGREWVVNVGRRDAASRIAHLVCELAVRLTAVGLVTDHQFELPMTQEQIGDAVGLTPVHVNRTIKGLVANGLIRRSRRYVGTDNWAELREAAGFNSRYLHLESQLAGAIA